MSVKTEYTRRSVLGAALKGSVAATALALGGGTPFLNSRKAYAAAVDISNQELRTIGLSVTVQERILDDFRAKSGVGSTTGTAATFPDAQTKILSGSKDFDAWETIGERLPAVVMTNNIDPVPTSATPLPR